MADAGRGVAEEMDPIFSAERLSVPSDRLRRVEDWMGTLERFTTDWRPALALHEDLEANGFALEVA
jgi:hypothetical protein